MWQTMRGYDSRPAAESDMPHVATDPAYDYRIVSDGERHVIERTPRPIPTMRRYVPESDIRASWDAVHPIPGVSDMYAVRWGRFWYVLDRVTGSTIGTPCRTRDDAADYGRYRARGHYA